MKSISELRELYKKISSSKDLNLTIEELIAKDKLSKKSALNLVNLQQSWERLEKVVSTTKLDSSLEYMFSELLGHFYAAESLFLFYLSDKNTAETQLNQSLKVSQEVLVDLSSFIAKYSIIGGNLELLDSILKLNQGHSLRDDLARELFA